MPVSSALCRSGSRNPLEQSTPTADPVRCRGKPFQLLLLKLLHVAKLNIHWGNEKKQSPVSEEKDQCTTLQFVPLFQSGLLYPLKTLRSDPAAHHLGHSLWMRGTVSPEI